MYGQSRRTSFIPSSGFSLQSANHTDISHPAFHHVPPTPHSWALTLSQNSQNGAGDFGCLQVAATAVDDPDWRTEDPVSAASWGPATSSPQGSFMPWASADLRRSIGLAVSLGRG